MDIHLNMSWSNVLESLFVENFQEHLNFVSEISQEEIFILDPELVVTTTVGTSPSHIPDLVNPASFSLVNSR